MSNANKLNLSWGILMVLTLSGMLMGEYAEAGFWITVSVAGITALKGRLLIDQFMELDQASPIIRRIVRAFGLVVPALMILTYLLGPELAQVTQLPGN
ncbi:cytochrome C oxidase subunit IV family protein [Thiolapillus sp.]